MKKSIALILSIIMIICVSTPLLATEGMTIYFDSGSTSQVEFSPKVSISFPWDTVPSSSERAIVTLYTPSPVKSIEETAHFIATLPEYLDDWMPENGGSKVNTASKGENDKYITMFQLRACFLDENGDYTKPGADVQASAIFEETVEVTLENGSWMKIPCKLELLEDATIFWDVSMDKNITFNLNQGNDMSAYIGATSDTQAPYTIKWTVDGDAEITGIKGSSGSTSTGNKTNNIIKPTDKTEFLGSTVTVRPTSTSDFWLGSTLHDNTGKEISNWRVLIRVNGKMDTIDNIDDIKTAIENRTPVELPANMKTEVIAGDATIEAHFSKYFKNKLKAVKFAQQGSFGMDGGVAVKLDLRGLDSSKLVLYSYDPVKNSYSMLPEQTYLIDANGYLHFTTSMGNYVVVSEGPLA